MGLQVGGSSARWLARSSFTLFQHNLRLTSAAVCSKRKQSTRCYDVVVVGAGIVGLATARQLILRHPSLKFAVLDKENEVASHQSGHNSGVIHAGIYYTPGTLKAQLCVEGAQLMYQYCDQHDVPYKKLGKLIVAVSPEEVPLLDKLTERGRENGVPDLRVLGPNEIKEIEPNCVGLKALHSPHTGIVDFAEVTRSYGRVFESQGGHIHLNFHVADFTESTVNPDYPVTIKAKNTEERIQARYVITCGGLHSDRLADKSQCQYLPRIVPFRGEYLLLNPDKADLVRGNIYPVPNPKFPFLGVHFTPRMSGDVWLGPNAVLAFKREGYKVTQVSPKDLADALAFRGLRKLVYRNMGYAFSELYRGLNIAAQVKILQRFIPSLKVKDVQRGPAGVRAQALDGDGNLVEDFVFDSGSGGLGRHMLHVRNAPSPAATSSLAIANMVADKARLQFDL